MSDTTTSDEDTKKESADKVVIDGIEIEYETDPNAHNRVEPEDRGPGMDEPVHYTYARPEDKPSDREVRVCDAVKAGDRDLVTELIQKEKCDIHQRAEQDWTPLNFAAGKGDLDMVQLLVEELGADVTAVGRDRRRPLQIAKAATRKEVAHYLTDKEKALGAWEDPLKLRPYCKAYYLRQLREFSSWNEKRENWKINRYWSDEMKADFDKALEDEDVVFIHDDLTVTRSMWRGEHLIYDDVTADWQVFCKGNLGFEIPEDLQ